jgi:hypothetical protein
MGRFALKSGHLRQMPRTHFVRKISTGNNQFRYVRQQIASRILASVHACDTTTWDQEYHSNKIINNR